MRQTTKYVLHFSNEDWLRAKISFGQKVSSPKSAKYDYLPSRTKFSLYIRLNTQCCLSLVVLTYLGKDSFTWVNTLWGHKSYNDVTSWLTKVDVMINQSWCHFLTRKRFEVVFESKNRDWKWKEKNNQPRLYSGTENPPSWQRFATSTTRQALDCKSLTLKFFFKWLSLE